MSCCSVKIAHWKERAQPRLVFYLKNGVFFKENSKTNSLCTHHNEIAECIFNVPWSGIKSFWLIQVKWTVPDFRYLSTIEVIRAIFLNVPVSLLVKWRNKTFRINYPVKNIFFVQMEKDASLQLISERSVKKSNSMLNYTG